MGPNAPPPKVNAKCDVVMKLWVFGTRTDTHTHTHTHISQNLYILATRAVTNFTGKSAKLADILSFVAPAFRNGLQYRNSDWHVRSIVNWYTSFRNLVRFGAVIPEFRCLICVQQASVCTGVSVTAFARWRHTAISVDFSTNYCYCFTVIR